MSMGWRGGFDLGVMGLGVTQIMFIRFYDAEVATKSGPSGCNK